MKFLFLTPPAQYLHTTGYFFSNIPPLNLAQLASAIKEEHEVKIIDNSFIGYNENKLMSKIKNFNPDLVGITNNCIIDGNSTVRLASRIKKNFPDVKLICGGHYPTYNPGFFLKNGFDFVIRHEGELTIKELLEHIEKNKGDAEMIKGIAFMKKDRIITTKDRPFVKNIDNLPFPSRELLSHYKGIINGKKSTAIETVRGCPFNCDFCTVSGYWKNHVREKSNSRIIEELSLIKEQGFGEIAILDDSFAINPQKTIDLLRNILRERLDFDFIAQIRADTVANNHELIRLASKAGLRLVVIGFEAYSQTKSLRDKISFDANKKASDILRKNNILSYGTHIFGLPKQTKEDAESTLKYGMKFSDFFRLSVYTPMPYSRLYRELKNKGKIITEDLEKYHYGEYIIKDGRNPKDMNFDYFKTLFRYYTNPKTIASAFYSESSVKSRLTRKTYIIAVWYALNRFFGEVRKK